MACEAKSSCIYSSLYFMVASLWPRIFHVLIDVSKSCRLPRWNAIRILLFCLVIPWNRQTKSAIKVWNVFLDEGFQKWSFWGSHPLRHWIPSSCNVEKVVGEIWLFQQTHPPFHERMNKQTSLLYRGRSTSIGDHIMSVLSEWKHLKGADEMRKCKHVTPFLLQSQGHWAVSSPQLSLPV